MSWRERPAPAVGVTPALVLPLLATLPAQYATRVSLRSPSTRYPRQSPQSHVRKETGKTTIVHLALFNSSLNRIKKVKSLYIFFTYFCSFFTYLLFNDFIISHFSLKTFYYHNVFEAISYVYYIFIVFTFVLTCYDHGDAKLDVERY